MAFVETRITTRVSNNTHIILQNKFAHPLHNFNDALIKLLHAINC